jgi:hypothetical protein
MRQTTIQLATPDELRGRVSSVNQVFVQASGQIGAIESGFVATITTATFAVVSGGAGAIVVAALVGWRLPLLFRHEVRLTSLPPGSAPETARMRTLDPSEGPREEPASVAGGS